MRPKFEKRHYAIIAAALREMKPSKLYSDPAEHVASIAEIALWKKIIYRMVFHFDLDNPKFNEHRFLEACNLHKDE